jgi:hypothetical protein
MTRFAEPAAHAVGLRSAHCAEQGQGLFQVARGPGRLAKRIGQVSQPDVDMRLIVGGAKFFGDCQRPVQRLPGNSRPPGPDEHSP